MTFGSEDLELEHLSVNLPCTRSRCRILGKSPEPEFQVLPSSQAVVECESNDRMRCFVNAKAGCRMALGVVCMVPGSPYSLSFPSIINQLTGEESGDSNEFRKLWGKGFNL